MVDIDKEKHPNLFELLAEELRSYGYTDDCQAWTNIRIDKITPKRPFSWSKENIFPGWFHFDGPVSGCEVYRPWLENLLNQNETLYIEFTKARLGQ